MPEVAGVIAEPSVSGIACRRRRSPGLVVAAFLLLCSQGRSPGRDGVIAEGGVHLQLRQVHRVARRSTLPATGRSTRACWATRRLRRARAERQGPASCPGAPSCVSAAQLDGNAAVMPPAVCLGRHRRRTTAILAALRKAPVLTISDCDDFSRLGGIVPTVRRERPDALRLESRGREAAACQLSSKLARPGRSRVVITTRDRAVSRPGDR